jgi:hypothetical protein
LSDTFTPMPMAGSGEVTSPGAGPEPPAPEGQRGRGWQNAAPSAGLQVGRSGRSRDSLRC